MNISEYNKYVHNVERRTAAEKLLLYCGVPVELGGFAKLVDCAVIASYYPEAPLNGIYRAVGAMYGVTPKTVLRAVSYALSKAPDFAAAFSVVIGARIKLQYVHCGMAIALLGKIIDNPALSPLYDARLQTFITTPPQFDKASS